MRFRASFTSTFSSKSKSLTELTACNHTDRFDQLSDVQCKLQNRSGFTRCEFAPERSSLTKVELFDNGAWMVAVFLYYRRQALYHSRSDGCRKLRRHKGRAGFARPPILATIFGAATFSLFPPALSGQALKSDATEAPVTDKSDKACRFTFHDRIRFYRQTTFSPFALTGPLAGSAITTWGTGNPREWGQGFPGYGRRLLSGYSRQVIANSVGFGVALATGEDPRHYPTGEQGFWKRGLFAARQAVISHNSSGGLMPAYSRIIGEYSAGFISNAWYPKPYADTRSALYRGSTALASDIVWQEFKEFWPDVHRKLRFNRQHDGD